MANLSPDLTAALTKSGLADFFAGCTDAHRNEYLKWIGEAKRPETRKERIAKTIRMLGEKSAKERMRQSAKNR